jgi:hypothetical protein
VKNNKKGVDFMFYKSKVLIIAVVILTSAFIITSIFLIKSEPEPESEIKISKEESNKVSDVAGTSYVKYSSDQEKDSKAALFMKERKKKYGVDKSVDMIVRSNEIVKIGDRTISMEEIERETTVQKGDIYVKDLTGKTNNDNVKEYGIHVVQLGDNIWDVHFKLIQEYFKNRSKAISRNADEPLATGVSSGIGKLLKFSEKMVYIYNLNKNKITSDINIIQPLTKIVVYRMDEVFQILNQLDTENLDKIEFDGETIWISSEK